MSRATSTFKQKVRYWVLREVGDRDHPTKGHLIQHDCPWGAAVVARAVRELHSNGLIEKVPRSGGAFGAPSLHLTPKGASVLEQHLHRRSTGDNPLDVVAERFGQ